MQQLEMLVQPVIDGGPLAAPPVSPLPGDMAIVASGATGSFAGHDGAVALYGVDGWRFFAPFDGCAVFDTAGGDVWRYALGSGWTTAGLSGSALMIDGVQVVGSRQAAILDPQGGSGADSKARTAIAEILAALRTHGLIAT
ncbi:DUF2793 domain-containing protein [Sphingomicrobium flavum]|uniref:DUF2793 domain-containing protein n=1 Tax=Sphingomicrobium flavum TaxID=1229164 RepID=UPI0021ADA1EE|nr:DUF2793 domain-containing protein [Sphingomicrobium flavum]